ncbi:4-hydroxybenzoate polyprenyltransferase, mitochondrial [Neocloeon triangulifer]|uniref:4-hydroxybenzoate polyprenyltransferase, mitochondrial n=1 Tax=Neocloeon triangulifer TaxID=2078957 RepID=UPI00286F2420|nr:4-hydroxybenzoate polyprenyltransferase, mitochondrial [Neocloeon triangulifer]
MLFSAARRCLISRQSSRVVAKLFSSSLCPPKGPSGLLAVSRTCSPIRCDTCHHRQLAVLENFSSHYFTTSCQVNKRRESEAGLRCLQSRAISSAQLVDRAPDGIRPYLRLMRIDRPIGSWLLFWPCGWSIASSAAPGCLPDLGMLALFGAGAVIMRGAGCTINDMWDKDIDGKVSRTKDRPLVSGALSQGDALVFLAGQLGLGLAILLQLNWYSIVLGASSLGLVVVYPLMKRVTHWPQLVLGMTFNWGSLLGWSAVQGSCDWSACLPLYVAGVCWTIIYDTIYAHQDKAEDLMLGIKSTAIRFGDNTKLWLTGFGAAMAASLVLSGLNCDQTWPYYLSVGVISAHISQQLYTLDTSKANDCAKKFISNHYVGLLLFLGIVCGNYMKNRTTPKVTVEVDTKDKVKLSIPVAM